MSTSINQAKADHQRTAEALIAAVQKAFPVGSRVCVTMGKADVIGEVTGHSASYWHDPGTVYFRNSKTGARRKFDPTSDRFNARIIA